MVIEALGRSALPVEALTVSFSGWKWFLWSYGAKNALEHSYRVLAGLKHLDLHHEDKVRPGVDGIDKVSQLSRAAQNLETLSVESPF